MNEMQQAFERWATSRYYDIEKGSDGMYRSRDTMRAWHGWKFACRWADGAEQVDRSVAIPDGLETHEGYFKEQNKC